MATTKLYLDTRANAPGTPAPVKISLCLNGKTILYSTGVKVFPEQWDAKTCKIVRHPQAMYLNTVVTAAKNDWDISIIKLSESGKAKLARTPSELKQMILEYLYPEKFDSKKGEFLKRYVHFAESRSAAGTRTTYISTIARMKAYDPHIADREFEEIDRKWLSGFEKFLSLTAKSANARAIHFRNIRAVFNDAIDDDATAFYPFRKFKIKTQPTRKRSLTVEQVRTLLDYPCEDYQTIYRDMFMLMFYLCGINAVDLFSSKPEALRDGRLEYTRAKTRKLYSVKVEPEAMDIINRYRGHRYLLNIMDTRTSYSDFLRRMDRTLKQIGPVERHGLGGKKTRHPLFPDLSQYWCRHTWATIAAELDIPKETIAAGLGHGGNTVTDIYIRFDLRKVDEANRKIIDYVLNGAGEHSPASTRQ